MEQSDHPEQEGLYIYENSLENFTFHVKNILEKYMIFFKTP